MNKPNHQPVLLQEVVEAFSGMQLRYFLDGTLGAGGHARAILEAHPEIQLYIGMDQDPSAITLAQKQLPEWHSKLRLINDNFSNMTKHLHKLSITHVDGILLDLGVSSMQLDQPEKGFSFMRSGPLDMRMDPTTALTAEIIVNTWTEQDLGRIFRDYGEEKQWRKAAHTIVTARKQKSILTTTALTELLYPVLYRGKKTGIHPLTLIFQALRICVNQELTVIEETIPKAIELLTSGGRLSIISFHSLEDRIVKNSFRYAASDKQETVGIGGMFRSKIPIVTPITKRPICPTPNEAAQNPRSRSAKLRIVEKKG